MDILNIELPRRSYDDNLRNITHIFMEIKEVEYLNIYNRGRELKGRTPYKHTR